MKNWPFRARLHSRRARFLSPAMTEKASGPVTFYPGAGKGAAIAAFLNTA